MKNISFKHSTILGVVCVILAFACSEDIRPLRPGGITNGEIEYDWDATADSIQEATYTTYLGAGDVFIQDNMGNNSFNYWWNAHVLHTLVDAYTRTGDELYLPRMKNLVRGIKTRNGDTYQNVFNDDMLWLGNACVRAFVATNDSEYKDVAEFLWVDILTSYSDVFGGGITWKKDTPKLKNAVSNGPATILAMRLYELDNDDQYLDWAKDIYEWEKLNLVDPDTGAVWDHIEEIGGVVSTRKDWLFTYNMGTWIGSGLRLFKTTGEQMYLDDAIKSAKFLMNNSSYVSNGILKSEGEGDGGLFKGILVRYFTELILLPNLNSSDKEAFVNFLKFNIKTFHENGLSKPSMLSGHNWNELPSETVDLSTQLSGVMLIEAAAVLEMNNLF